MVINKKLFHLFLVLPLFILMINGRLSAQNSTSKENFHQHIKYFFEFDQWASTNLPYISERFVGNVKKEYFEDYYIGITGMDTLSEERKKHFEDIKETFKTSFLDSLKKKMQKFEIEFDAFLQEIGEFDSKKVQLHYDFSNQGKYSNEYIEQKESLYLGTFPVMEKIIIHYGDTHKIILTDIVLYNDYIYFENASFD